MILYPQLDLHGELIQFDDLYKERQNNNVNDCLARLHVLENVIKNEKSKGYVEHSHISNIRSNKICRHYDNLIIQ